MSPRAAWRLEDLGFTDVYDFVPGEVAWFGMGWEREGVKASVPNAGEVARRGTPVCRLDTPVVDARANVEAVGREVCIVVNDEGVVQGRLRAGALRSSPGVVARDVMELGPTTIRPSEELQPLVERMRRRGVRTIIVSDFKGRLIGILYREDAETRLAEISQPRLGDPGF